jgi:hypothetical protein
LVGSFSDDDEEPPMSPEALETVSGDVDGRMRALIKEALEDLAEDDDA